MVTPDRLLRNSKLLHPTNCVSLYSTSRGAPSRRLARRAAARARSRLPPSKTIAVSQKAKTIQKTFALKLHIPEHLTHPKQPSIPEHLTHPEQPSIPEHITHSKQSSFPCLSP